MKRKIVAVLTAATLAVGMLAGCGGGGSNSSSGSTDTSGTAASEGITTEDRKSTRLNSSHRN